MTTSRSARMSCRPWIEQIDGVLSDRAGYQGSFEAFSEPDLDFILNSLGELIEALPATSEIPMGNEDLPSEFDADLLADHLDSVASLNEYDEAARFIGGLKLRIRSLLADERIRPILIPDEKPTLEEWLEDYLGTGEDSTVAVIDLSLVPSDVIELVVAVMGRMVFEALQRHRRIHKNALPTALVLEEAHAFVRYHPLGAQSSSPRARCACGPSSGSRARGESSAWAWYLPANALPSFSPTILAQCNSFLLHRLVNDLDQNLVRKLVPDNLGGMLEDLPSLPTRHALLLGWAAVLPTLLEVRELPENERPDEAPTRTSGMSGQEPRNARRTGRE